MTLPITYPALRWRGGKWRIAPWIVSHFPPHEGYCEPFAGAASVLMRKPPSEFEAINDIDQDVVAFWRMLRERPHEFISQILMTPFSRAELYRAQEPVPADFGAPAAIELEQARRLWVRCYQGRGSSSRKSGWRFQPTQEFRGVRWNTNIPRLAARVHGLVDIAARLRFVQIERADWADAIARWDTPRLLFYIDPPYADGREHSRNLYAHEMSDLDHARLAGVLHSIKGMAVVSGLHGLYDDLYAGWQTFEKAAFGEMQKPMTEVLWLNPAAIAASGREAVR